VYDSRYFLADAIMFVGLQAKLMAFGAAVLGVLTLLLRMKVLKKQRNKARKQTDVLKARHQVIKQKRVIKRKEQERLVSRRADLKKELDKEGEDFKGVDNFSDPNDF